MKVIRKILLSMAGAVVAGMAAWVFIILFFPSTPIEKGMLIMLICFGTGFFVTMGLAVRSGR